MIVDKELAMALDRMDTLLKAGLGLLSVGDQSATAIAARRDMRLIREAIQGKPIPTPELENNAAAS